MRSLFLVGLLAISACSPQPEPQTSPDLAAPAQALTCFRENGLTMLAAHRGGPAPGYAENALSGLERLGGLGVLYAEIDVRQTADGVFYLLHDDTLDRTTNGTGPVRGRNWADLEPLLLIDNDGRETTDTIPTLDQAIALAREFDIILNLDLKSVTPTEIMANIEANQARDLVAIIAYSVEDAAALHAIDPGIVLSYPNDISSLTESGVNLEAGYAWLGMDAVDPQEDARLAELGVETSIGLFRREDGSAEPYLEARSAGIELLSIDNVDAAVQALGGPDQMRQAIETCTPSTG